MAGTRAALRRGAGLAGALLGGALALSHQQRHAQRSVAQQEAKPSSVLFMGTGTSLGNPHLNCLLGLTPHAGPGGCEVCSTALKEGPSSPNWRGNPSLLVMYNGHEDGQTRYVQIDVGKTFMENSRRFYPAHGVPRLDAVVLTHEHADATLGLDDLRCAQARNKDMDVFMTWDTFRSVRTAFPYLFHNCPVPKFVGAGKQVPEAERAALAGPAGEKPKTFIASLRWNVIGRPSLEDEIVPFNAAGLEMTPFPVFHGTNYLSLGFAMGKGKRKFVYISDASRIPDKVMRQLKEWDIEYLVIDTLHPHQRYVSHFSLDESLEVIEELRPAKTLLVGVSHSFDHHAANADLAKLKASKGLDVQLAFDGQHIELPDLEL